MYKSITTFVLSLLFVGSTVHFHGSYDIGKSEQGMCDVDCNNKQHKTSSPDCDRCLNEETQRTAFEETGRSPLNKSESLLILAKTNSTSGFLLVELYGRPPPSLL